MGCLHRVVQHVPADEARIGIATIGAVRYAYFRN